MGLKELFDGCLQIEPKSQTPDALSGKDGLPTSKGVLLFADAHDGPIQLLICANMRRTATARLFHKDQEALSKRTDITEITHKIYYTSCFNDLASLLEYRRVGRQVYPVSYKKLLNLGKRSYVKIDITAKWPAFELSGKSYCSNDEMVFGTFPTRRAALDFIEILRNAFLLCQRPGMINSPQKAGSCPYLQMESCPAPCVGNISKASYMGQIKDAISAACGNVDEQLERLAVMMKGLSASTEFEKANAVKKQLDQLERLKAASYKWTCDLSNWGVLHIDKLSKIKVEGKRKKQQTFAAFVIRNGYIRPLEPFTLDGIEGVSKSLAELFGADETTADAKDELMSLVSFSLYRSKRAGVWINCSKGKLPDSHRITNAICKRFAIEPQVP
jgi:excinuclease UvrABC nuclease subunit